MRRLLTHAGRRAFQWITFLPSLKCYPQRTHRARNCDVTVRVSCQLTVQVPVRQQAKCEAKHWFSHWLHSKWKVLKKHIKREIALLKHFFSPYNIEISNLYSYHIFKYWNFDMLCFSLFLCPNGKLGCCWNVRQVAVFTYTGIQSRVPPLGVCSVVHLYRAEWVRSLFSRGSYYSKHYSCKFASFPPTF